ncbi:hypothetical protein ACHAXA_003321 [Cyclostephanos tholiformis]|uniref:CAP-Gly domain-containing protein n=1 Tax=Cyclostephanos tholiformis TaxID=382380 RepID=A0ABD3SBE5_9STRA
MTMSEDNEPLQLNDPVTVESVSGSGSSPSSSSSSSSSSPILEGIVAHLGPVQFAPGDDWIGIRLTGPSVGRGKNDGTVRGVWYFDVGSVGDNAATNGMFVRRSTVSKRKLSKLDLMRLRRELSAANNNAVGVPPPGGVAARVGTTTTRTTRSGTAIGANPSKGVEVASSGNTTPGRGTATSGMSKVDELRAKREALARERGGGGGIFSARERSGATNGTDVNDKAGIGTGEGGGGNDESKSNDVDDAWHERETGGGGEEKTTAIPPPKINLTSATPGYRAELARLHGKIANLETELRNKNSECASLQSSLDFMSKGAEQSTHDAVRMYAMGALAMTEARGGGAQQATTTPRGTPAKGSPGGRGSARRSLGSEMKLEGNDRNDGDDSDEEDDDENDDDEEEESDEEEDVVNQAAAAVSRALVERNNELKQQLADMTIANADLSHRLSDTEERLSNVTQRFERANENYQNERHARSEDVSIFNSEKAGLMSQLYSLQRELKILQERVSDKSLSQEHSHVTLAKLRADLTSLQRKNEELANDKMELENTLEDLVLDKEGLGQEKEALEDQLEELRIDLESAQLELEDAKAQLEAGRNAEASAFEGDVEGGAPDDGAAQDVARSLTLQNTRLRTALIRLREQSEVERNELQRQLKTYQSDSVDKEEIRTELAELRKRYFSTLAEMQDLKDTIDQTSALEETIETLSDKVWNLEDTNANLERTIRELEESAEIAAEMEEVQAEELKMVLRDLEGRDALVRNLEEAIRMQRRREEDFQRYVSEFRASIVTLKQEKAALLAATDDDRDDKANLLATSKKALAQAALLASDAAEARKRSADATFQMITARSATYLSQRLELLLPSPVVSAELAAVKGEMSLAKVADKASVSLTAVEKVFNIAIEKGSLAVSEFNTLEEGTSMALSDAASQQIAVINHQAMFASITIEAATDALRLLAAGQWPDLLSEEISTDLGSVILHSITDLDLALSDQLKLLISEGVLSPMRSSLSDLDQYVKNTRLAVFGSRDESGKTVIPVDWKPPGWEALKNLSLGRFACLGATAALCSAVSPMDDTENELPPATPRYLADVLTKAKQCCASILDVCNNLPGLKLDNNDVLTSLDELCDQYRIDSNLLFESIKTALSGQSITSMDVTNFSSLLEKVFSTVRLLAALVRKAELDRGDMKHHHFLSAEFGDSWQGVTTIVSQVRNMNGDPEDVNYLMRARAIENHLSEAVENEPRLVNANAKIVSLEKKLSSRSKEIEMQNRRLAELETLLTRVTSATSMSPMKGSMLSTAAPSGDTAETHKLKDEVRVLQEALDVMQKQGEEYEKEIRSLKDKSRLRTAGGSRAISKASSMDLEATPNQFGQVSGSKSAGPTSRDVLLESVSLETALFRPALNSALQTSVYWKSKAVGAAISNLAPLNVKTGINARTGLDNLYLRRNETDFMNEIFLAKSECRLVLSSLTIADLSNNYTSARAYFNFEQEKKRTVEQRLLRAESCFSPKTSNLLPYSPKTGTRNDNIFARIALPCRIGAGYDAVPLMVTSADLRNLHSFLIQ